MWLCSTHLWNQIFELFVSLITLCCLCLLAALSFVRKLRFNVSLSNELKETHSVCCLHVGIRVTTLGRLDLTASFEEHLRNIKTQFHPANGSLCNSNKESKKAFESQHILSIYKHTIHVMYFSMSSHANYRIGPTIRLFFFHDSCEDSSLEVDFSFFRIATFEIFV